jgi:hypothetical protein
MCYHPCPCPCHGIYRGQAFLCEERLRAAQNVRVLCEKRPSNAHERGLCEADPGHALLLFGTLGGCLLMTWLSFAVQDRSNWSRCSGVPRRKNGARQINIVGFPYASADPVQDGPTPRVIFCFHFFLLKKKCTSSERGLYITRWLAVSEVGSNDYILSTFCGEPDHLDRISSTKNADLRIPYTDPGRRGRAHGAGQDPFMEWCFRFFRRKANIHTAPVT